MKSHLGGTWRDVEEIRDLPDPVVLEMVQDDDRPVVGWQLVDRGANAVSSLLSQEQVFDAGKIAHVRHHTTAGGIELGVGILEGILTIPPPRAEPL